MPTLMAAFKRQLFFAASACCGSRLGPLYREWLLLEHADESAIHEQQQTRLSRLLREAVRDVPFYRERLAASSCPVLADFPILTKSLIGEHFASLMSDALRPTFDQGPGRGYSWVMVQTGGTSGVPTRVIHDAAFRDQGRCSRFFSQYLCGFPWGEPYLWLWGSMAEIHQARESWPKRIMNRLAAAELINAFQMDEHRLEGYVDRINRSPARHLMAYVDAAAQLARYIRQRGVAIRPLSSIMACAGPVTDSTRQLLEEVFQARVHNKYGSRDCTDMACECDRGGLHLYSHHVCLEVVDDAGRPVPAGATGRFLVTLLGNSSFPLIRYDIGDRGALCERRCSCGRPFPLLDRVEGRQLEFLRSPRGDYVSPVYIRHLIGVVHNPGSIRCFQMIQETTTRYSLDLVLDSVVTPVEWARMVEKITRDLQAVLGAEAQLTIRRADAIAPSISGKFRYVINRVGGGG